jgi:mannose-6-phosphate isomerase-like protein (cupin superfamily)
MNEDNENGTDDTNKPALLRKAASICRWDGVERLQYKQEGSAPFRDITRQVLFDDADLAAQVRYFEMQAGGYSTLERHQHMHAVMILRGAGSCLVGEQVFDVAEGDLVRIPALHWHQFRATGTQPLGFLCVVNRERDRPQLPDAQALEALERIPAVAHFIRR